MNTPTYSDIMIGRIDKAYIDSISHETGIDYEEATLYSLESDSPCIANDIIRYIIEQSINNLNVSDRSKSILHDRVYTNSIDSGFIDDSLDAFPESEHKVIKSLMEIF